MQTLVIALSSLVEGDLTCLPLVLSADHTDLLEAASRLPRLIVTRSALINVLQSWQYQQFNAEDVQQWASFVRRGYVARRWSGPQPSIDIAYDPNDEDLIVEIIARLDEIGDIVDGVIDSNELAEMLRNLQS